MDIRNVLTIIAGVLVVAGAAAGYLPPVHIANPETGECRYYFAGDETHRNPLPNGTWFVVGLSGEDRNVCQLACLQYSSEGGVWYGLQCDCLGKAEEGCTNWCRIKRGDWKGDSACVCPAGTEWSPEEGCLNGPGNIVETTAVAEVETTAIAETTVRQMADGSDESALWAGLLLVVIVTMIGIYYISRKNA